MLETDAAHAIREREQEIVVVVVLRAEQPIRLLHEIAVRLELLVRSPRADRARSANRLRRTGRAAPRVEIDEPIVLAREQRRVDERLQVRLGEARRIARSCWRRRAQSAKRQPAGSLRLGTTRMRDA